MIVRIDRSRRVSNLTCRWLRLGFVLLLLGGSLWAHPNSPAPEYENLFNRSSGWTGADGTYSYPQPDGSTLWGFSDTFFGEVVEGRRAEPFRFVNNSFIRQHGSDIKVLKAPVFEPPGGKSWFWLFDGTRDNQILLGQFEGHGDGGFGFRQIGLWYARFELSPDGARVNELARLPYFFSDDEQLITFGPALVETQSWDYIYGVRDAEGARHSVVARVPRGRMGDPGLWRFYDGVGWSKNMKSVLTLFSGAAMEASVHRTRDGGYLYIGTDHAGMGSDIICRYAKSPQGPWGEPILVGTAPEHEGDIFAYNAKAHPELTRDGRILVSYNVNTSDLQKVVAVADIYRPRFFWWAPPQTGWLPVND